jgi:hypothetical protein
MVGTTSRRILLTALLALVALMVAVPSAGAAEKAIWGPSTFPSGSAVCSQGCSAFPTYRTLGVDYYEFQLHFSAIAPTRPANPRNPNDPAYLWPKANDNLIANATANGVKIYAMVTFSPPWANGGQNEYGAPDPKAFADFAYAASKRYPMIDTWQVWGEPMEGINFSPMPPNSPVGPSTYGQLIDTTYGALKEANPANRVVGGGTISQGVIGMKNWINWLRLPNGQMPRMDMWSHNAFDPRYPNLADNPLSPDFRGLNDIDTLYQDLSAAYNPAAATPVPPSCKKKKGKKASASKKSKKCAKSKKAAASKKSKKCKKKCKKKGKKAGASKKSKKCKLPPVQAPAAQPVPKLWIGEWTVVSDHATNVFGNDYYVSREEQAQRLTAAYNMVNQLPYVAGLGWFTLQDQPQTSTSASWGLMTSNGVPKPSFSAYAAAP